MKFLTIFSVTFLLTFVSLASVPSEQYRFLHPVIKEHGGTVEFPGAAHQPKAASKVLLDVSSDKKSGKVLEGLDRAALILNQYTHAGSGIGNGLKIAVVLHGPATVAALSEEAFARHAKPYARDKGETRNPNLELIKKLREAGVEVFVCGQALAHHDYATSDVAKEVTTAVSAASVNINLQSQGYAYIPFH